MPFVSRAQQRFAFGTDQDWAHDWAKKTKNFKDLPEHVGDKKSKKGAGPVGHGMTDRGTHKLLDCPSCEHGQHDACKKRAY